jgi:hypothetical protein
MNPSFQKTLQTVAERVSEASLAEAQVSPGGDQKRWSGQGVAQHLILSFRSTATEVRGWLNSKRGPGYSPGWRQRIIRAQLFWFGAMNRGVPAMHSLYPAPSAPQDGKALAARLLAEGEALDQALNEGRRKYRMRPCGIHPVYGPMNEEQWRTYHNVHCLHHLVQFEEAIAFARSHPELLGTPAREAFAANQVLGEDD